MTLAAEQAKTERQLFWLFEIELTYRIDGKPWIRADAPNTACWSIDHLAEGKPSRVRQFLRSTNTASTYTEKATLILCQGTASTWFYDTATGRLYVNTSAGDDPATASKYFLSSHFWKYFSTSQYQAPNELVVNGVWVEPRLGKVAAEVTQEVNDFLEVGIQQTWGSIKIANSDGKYDKSLMTYIWHLCPCVMRIGAPGDAYANLVTINRGRTGNIEWNDDAISIDFEDPGLAED